MPQNPLINEWQHDLCFVHYSSIFQDCRLDLDVSLYDSTPPGLVLAFLLRAGHELITQPGIFQDCRLDLDVGLYNTTPPGLVLAILLCGGPEPVAQSLNQCLNIPVAVWFGSSYRVGCSVTTVKHIKRNKDLGDVCNKAKLFDHLLGGYPWSNDYG